MEDDVAEAYSYLLSTIAILFEEEVKFSKLKTACERTGVLLTKDFKESIKKAQDHRDIFEVLENPLYCNWLNVRLLKTIARNICNIKAVNFIQKYEEHIYSRKVSSVKKYFTPRYFNKETLSVIEVKFNCSSEELTVKEVIDHNEKVEKVLNIFTGGTSAIGVEPGCLKLTFVIPLQCTIDAYNTAMKNFLKLRKFHIQYLEIKSFPKVFAFSHPDKQLTHSILSSSPPKCKYICKF